MKIRAFKSIGDRQPVIAEVSHVVIEKNDGTPVAVASQVAGDICCCVTADDPEFHRFLRTLGIDQVTIVENLSEYFTPVDRRQNLPVLLGPKRNG